MPFMFRSFDQCTDFGSILPELREQLTILGTARAYAAISKGVKASQRMQVPTLAPG